MSIAVNVNDTTSAGLTSTAGSLNTSSAADLQNNFLTLLVAQLKNQDPTNPMDNSQLTSQLAQISTLNGIEKLNTTLGSISGQINDSQQLQAAALVGHGVMVPGSSILVGNSATTPFGVELEQASDKTTATITDSGGKVMRTIELGGLSAGVHTFSWDGTLSDGTAAPDGAYSVTINASSNGAAQLAQPLTFALVNGITRADSGSLLDLGTYGTTTLDQVRQII
ncbi:flagellar hook assembly protein FlgD [Entomohabitans teleogrylli]|uniref:flagellar hook assembly protein FlgD n=1 Tax=Entomohabitans teleogrylli TaxID=1384589 RepID=UPI00073D1F01|nr:flagellar hook assembly protein FlgD [Entomohabitans teleogrylli]